MREEPSESLDSKAATTAPDEGDAHSTENSPQRLEALLVDEAEGEVKPVKAQTASSSWLIVVLLLLVLLAAGCILALLKLPPTTPQPQSLPDPSVEVRVPMPSRQFSVESETAEKTAVAVEKIETAAVNEPSPEPRNAAAEKVDKNSAVPVEKAADTRLYSVVVGPFISSDSLERGNELLQDMGLQAEQQKGRGLVHMVRLQQGVYRADEAQQQLEKLKKHVKSAFLLPRGDKKALYAGSFFEVERAERLQQQLRGKGLDLELVEAGVNMTGTMLVALQADRKTARQLADLISQRGLNVQVSEAR